MSLAKVHATDGAIDSKVAICNHTLHHRDEDGTPLGSWIESTGVYGIRVTCRVCDKFFGYLPNEQGRSDQELYEAYLEQQRRLACPGCGEEPFLG
ncbi:MAG: hypothetical protein SGI77_13975 [Pirellulaceae bacterium]|nr:hypothetical protein [Pirellulaceae bacterium]